MPTLLSKGYDLLARLDGPSAGVAITYEQWNRELGIQEGSTDITAASGDALVGRTVFVSNRQDGARVEFGERDYIIKASALSREPREGDRIVQVFDDGETLTYEVLPPSTNEPAVRWSDPQRVRYRVHVKLVNIES